MSDGWVRVVFACEVDDDGNCPVCEDVDYGDCPCPGPTMEDEYEYKEINGVLFAKRKPE